MESTRVKPKLLLATNNPGKLAEMRALLETVVGLQLVSPEELGLELEIPETGSSYRENAEIKARAFREACGLVTLADDSGLEIEALNGAPGLHSARFSPKKGATAADRRQLLLERLSGHPQPWKARFVSTVCLALPDGEMHFAEGQCRGQIIPEERGSFGFGYDPIFLVEGQRQTMAELPMAQKNTLSHRALSIQAVQDRIQALAKSV